MRFTKENVQNAINKYFWQVVFEPCGDLIAAIDALDDTPEKVAVPKSFHEWYKAIDKDCHVTDISKQFALWKICQFGFSYNLQDYNDKDVSDNELANWVSDNKMLAINAVLNGYVIEGEPLYYIILPFKKVENGDVDRYKSMSIYIAIDKEGAFRLSYNQPHVAWGWKVKFTEAEIKAIDERYWPFAILAKEEVVE